MLAHGLGEVLRDRVAQRLLAGRADADAGLEHPAWRLAVAEAGQLDLAGDRLERPIDVAIELGLVDLDVQLDLVPLEGFDRDSSQGGECYRWGSRLDRWPRVGRPRSRRAPKRRAPIRQNGGDAVLEAHTPSPTPHTDQLDLRIGDGSAPPSTCTASRPAPRAR